MTTITSIPMKALAGLDLQQGDIVRIVEARGDKMIVEINRDEFDQSTSAAANWVNTAKGTVHLGENSTADDACMHYCAEKYELE
ncbi:MAG: hypothetical protein CMJ78_02165 [Planctomycetaceae bacterium]|nr:hypothetical protein [Planctomycetaceae bacterium]